MFWTAHLSIIAISFMLLLGLMTNYAHAQTQTPDTLAAYIDLEGGNYFHSGQYAQIVGNVVDITTQKPVSGATVNFILSEPNGTTIKIGSTTSESNSSYSFTMPVTDGFGFGEYVVNPYAQKEGYSTGQDDNGALFFVVARENKQVITAEGQDFPLYTESVNLQTGNFTFNKDSKSLSFDINKIKGNYMPKGISWIDPSQLPVYADELFVTFKRPLISGPFHVFVNSQEADAQISENQTHYFMHMVFLDPNNNGKGNVSIVGTYVVPEFPFAIPVLLIGITSLIVLLRINLRNLV